jgi:predicted dehydrogenase
MIRLGILGCGRVVQNRYVEVFQKELIDIKVSVVCDKVKKKADVVANLLRCKAVYNEKNLLSSSDVDIVLICTESGNHYSHSLAALEAGKHVIVEKPPALIPSQIIKLEQIAKKEKLMFAVIFQNRFNPAMKKLKETFEKNRFGKIILATIRLRWCRYQEYYEDGWHGTWKLDGGVVNQQAIHHVDALQWVCGSVDQVCSSTGNMLNRLEAEDTMIALVKFKSGAMGVIEATTAARPKDFEASMSIVGEKGTVVIGGIALNKIETWQFVDETEDDKKIPLLHSEEVPTGYGLSHGPLLEEIFDRIKKGVITPPISGSDSVPTVSLVHALYSSDEKKSWVKLEEKNLSKKLGKNEN